MPNDWIAFSVTPDTYTNDGSYGLDPTAFGNFDGVTAHGGKTWVAGWSAGPEAIAQNLATRLTGNQTYTLSGWLHQAIRGDLNNPGGYNIGLFNTSTSSSVIFAAIGNTASSAAGWNLYSTTFVAPSDAADFDQIVFFPTGTGGGAYPGLDDVSLSAVPEPASLMAIALGVAGLRRRRKNKSTD